MNTFQSKNPEVAKNDCESSEQTNKKNQKQKAKPQKIESSLFLIGFLSIKALLKTSVPTAWATSGVTELKLWNHRAQTSV